MTLPPKYQTRWIYGAAAAISAVIFCMLPLSFILRIYTQFSYSYQIISLPGVALSTYLAGLIIWHSGKRLWGDSFFMGVKTVALSFLIFGFGIALIQLKNMLLEQESLSHIFAGIVVLISFIAFPVIWNYFDHSRWSGFYMASGISLIIITLLFFLYRHAGLNLFTILGELLFMLVFIPVGTFVLGSFITLGIPYIIGGTISLLFTSHNYAEIAPSPK